jgi:hypothetical protein
MKAFLILLGAAGAALIIGLILRARHEPRPPLYVVLVEIVCVMGFLFGMAYAFTSWAEGEKQAVLRALLYFALPWVIVGVLAWLGGLRLSGRERGMGQSGTEAVETPDAEQ